MVRFPTLLFTCLVLTYLRLIQTSFFFFSSISSVLLSNQIGRTFRLLRYGACVMELSLVNCNLGPDGLMLLANELLLDRTCHVSFINRHANGAFLLKALIQVLTCSRKLQCFIGSFYHSGIFFCVAPSQPNLVCRLKCGLVLPFTNP